MLLSFKKDDLEKAQDCLDQVRPMPLLSAFVGSCLLLYHCSDELTLSWGGGAGCGYSAAASRAG